MSDSDVKGEPGGELDDRLNEAMNAVFAEPVPRDVRERVIERAAAWTPASVPDLRALIAEATHPAAATQTPASRAGRVRWKWFPQAAGALAASLLLAVGLVVFHVATRDGSIVTVTSDDATVGQSDSLAKRRTHELGDMVDSRSAATMGLTAEYSRPSISAIVAENAPIIVTTGPDKPVHLGLWRRYPSGGNSVHIWDWSRSPISRVAMEADWFRSESVALSPDGKLLVRAGGEIIDLDTGERKPIDLGGAVYRVDNATYTRIGGMQFSSDGSRIALLLSLPDEEEGFPRIGESVIQVVEFPTARVLFQFPAGESYQLRVVFSRDGKQVVAGERDKQILVHQWIVRRDATTGEVLKRYEPVMEKQLLAVAVSPDGRFVAASQRNGDVLVWESDSGRLAQRIQTTFYESVGSYSSANALRFSPDSKLLAVSDDGVRVKLYDTATGRLIRELSRINSTKDLRWSDDGRTLTTISEVALGEGSSGFPPERYDVYPFVEEWDWQSGERIRSLVAPLPELLRLRALTTGDPVNQASDRDQDRLRREANATTDVKVLTPDEAVKRETDESVTVEFRVGSVALLASDQPPGVSHRFAPIMLTATARLKDGGKFYAVLDGRLGEDIWQLAFDPAKYLKERTIQVTGTIRTVELPAEGTYYGIVAVNPMQFRVVK
jgi:WD40 repeat protein